MRIGDVVYYAPRHNRYIGVIVGIDVDDHRAHYWLAYALGGETMDHLIRIPHEEVEWVASVADTGVGRDLVREQYRDRVTGARAEMNTPW